MCLIICTFHPSEHCPDLASVEGCSQPIIAIHHDLCFWLGDLSSSLHLLEVFAHVCKDQCRPALLDSEAAIVSLRAHSGKVLNLSRIDLSRPASFTVSYSAECAGFQ